MATEFNYKEYLASREWALKREAVRQRSGGVCERCKNAPHQSTHHTTYERIGRELLTDLLGVCNDCHKFLSGKTDFDPLTNQPMTSMPVAISNGVVPTDGRPALMSLWERYFHNLNIPCERQPVSFKIKDGEFIGIPLTWTIVPDFRLTLTHSNGAQRHIWCDVNQRPFIPNQIDAYKQVVDQTRATFLLLEGPPTNKFYQGIEGTPPYNINNYFVGIDSHDYPHTEGRFYVNPAESFDELSDHTIHTEKGDQTYKDFGQDYHFTVTNASTGELITIFRRYGRTTTALRGANRRI